jgi:heme oxygenase
MTISTALKERTGEAHRRAESRDLQRRLVQGRIDEASLVAYLGQLHHVHTTLERLFDANPSLAAAIGWSDAFRHSRRLPESVAPELATTSVVNAIETAVDAEPSTLLGFFYVLEGSMNGNRFIVRALQHGPLAGVCDLSYFDPYGEEQPQHWAAFKTTLDAATLDATQQAAVVDAALVMFDAIAEIADAVGHAESADSSGSLATT